MTPADWMAAIGMGCIVLAGVVMLLGFAWTLFRDDEPVGAFVVALLGIGLMLGVLSGVASNWPAVLR